MRGIISLSWALVVVAGVLLTPISRALAQRTSCSGLDDSAKVEQQALCWLEADNRGDALCEAKRGGVSTCILQSVAWCADAMLDDAAVSNACFLSNIRAGQFEEALAIAEYLQTPTQEVQQCEKALSSVVVRIVSEPESASIEVDGRAAGKAPLETTLAQHWWKSRVKARFGSGNEAVEVVAASERLMAVFDRRTCSMGELVLQGPAMAAKAPGLKAHITGAVGATKIKATRKEPEEGVSVAGIALTAAGGAALITGVILVTIAEANAAGISSKTDGAGDTWNSVKGDYESITPFRVGGWVSIGAGAVLTTIGVLFLTNAFDEPLSENASSAAAALANGRISWRW
jgi:hypothetical protein